jgi:hypothetical protein
MSSALPEKSNAPYVFQLPASRPSLCAGHLAACGDGPSDLDHAYHEFVDLRAATDSDVGSMQVTGLLDELMDRIGEVAGKWDVRLSPNCNL